jgi:hypothetical protein
MRPDSFALAKMEGQFRLQCPPDCDPRPERWQFRLSSPCPQLRVALAIGDRAVTRVRTLALSAGAGHLSGRVEGRLACGSA